MRKKKEIAICLICIFFCISFIIFVKLFKRYLNDPFPWSIFEEKKLEPILLTQEQKKDDFEQFYSLICEKIPFLDDSCEIYGIDFQARKKIYEETITSAESNLDFYAAMIGIGQEVCSFHTSVLFPKYDYLSTLRCDNNKIIRSKSTKITQTKWEAEIREEAMKYKASDFILLREVDGHYYVGNEFLSNSESEYKSLELKEINGQEPADYFMQGVFLFGINYDNTSGKSYRSSVFINKVEGELIEVVWVDQQGKNFTEQLYYSRKLELIADYGYLYNAELVFYPLPDVHNTIYHYSDEERGLEFIRIANFEDGETQLKKIMEKLKYENVIIDLRNNRGGTYNYGEKNIYPYLYIENCLITERWKRSIDSIEKDPLTMRINRTEKTGKDQDYNYYKRTVEALGKSDVQKNVIYLTDNKTGSAADSFVGIIKDNGLGTIIGEETGGEGKSGTMTCAMLNNSGILFTYYPSVPCDEEGEALYYPGVSPDIYVSWNQEEYDKRSIFRKDGTSEEYINMLEYDPVLNAAIEYFEKEGTQ